MGTLIDFINEMIGDIRIRDEKIREYTSAFEGMLSSRTRDFCQVKDELNVAVLNLGKVQDAAQRSNQVKSHFLAKVTHEIRTPMNGILGLAELLLETDLTGEQIRFAEGIQHSGQSLMAIINNILDFSKLEAGKVELESSPFNLRLLIGDLLQLVAPMGRSKCVELKLDIADGTEIFLKGDQTRLRQVLVNLLSNAVKFTEDGKVVVRASTIEDGDRTVILKISVVDTGIGICHEDRHKIFEPFSQANGSIMKYGGTGLGLTISRELVSLMGGTLDYESEPGKGSNFFFSVKLERGQEMEFETEHLVKDRGLSDDRYPHTEEVAPEGRGEDIHVLVVDDDALNREIIEAMLKALGCSVSLATNGREALEAFSMSGEKEYDLIFMDCRMPVMDGYQSASEIRELETSRGFADRTPIIALTGNAMEEDRERCLKSGMDDYLAKPVMLNHVLGAVERWFGKMVKEDVGSSVEFYEADSSNMMDDIALNDADCLCTIDRNVLQALQDFQVEGEPSFLKKVIDSYLSDSEIRISRLREALSVEDTEGLLRCAHNLKSSSANVGAFSLSEISRRLEINCRNKSLEDANFLVEAIEAEFSKVEGALRKEAAFL